MHDQLGGNSLIGYLRTCKRWISYVRLSRGFPTRMLNSEWVSERGKEKERERNVYPRIMSELNIGATHTYSPPQLSLPTLLIVINQRSIYTRILIWICANFQVFNRGILCAITNNEVTPRWQSWNKTRLISLFLVNVLRLFYILYFHIPSALVLYVIITLFQRSPFFIMWR